MKSHEEKLVAPLSEKKAESGSLRVMIVSEPGIDGVFRHVEALARFLCSKGVHTDLAYSSIRGSDALRELIRFVEEHGGYTLDLKTGSWPAPGDLPAFFALLRFVKQRRPHLLHAHSSKAGTLVRAMRFRGVQVPLFYTPHAYYGMGRRRSPLPLLFEWIEASLSRVGRTINVSNTEAEYAHVKLGVPRESQLLIPNGIDCERFCPATEEARAKIRQSLGLPRDALVLGTVARYCYQKDPLTLHKAVRSVLQRHSRLWFVHIGKGQPLWDEVDALGAHDRVLRIESVQPIDSFYKSLDAFVLASRYEGFSLSLLEAIATNLPLILTRVDGNVDLDQIGLNHLYWAPPNNADALAGAINSWVLSHPISVNHREIACKYFRDDVTHNRILREYQMAAVSSHIAT